MKMPATSRHPDPRPSICVRLEEYPAKTNRFFHTYRESVAPALQTLRRFAAASRTLQRTRSKTSVFLHSRTMCRSIRGRNESPYHVPRSMKYGPCYGCERVMQPHYTQVRSRERNRAEARNLATLFPLRRGF